MGRHLAGNGFNAFWEILWRKGYPLAHGKRGFVRSGSVRRIFFSDLSKGVLGLFD